MQPIVETLPSRVRRDLGPSSAAAGEPGKYETHASLPRASAGCPRSLALGDRGSMNPVRASRERLPHRSWVIIPR